MEASTSTARELFGRLQDARPEPVFGVGPRVALVNVDLQRAYTATDDFSTAYRTDPDQLRYVNQLAEAVRGLGGPVVWTFCAYERSGADCGVWGTRSDTPDSLQNITVGSERAQLDPMLHIATDDVVLRKRMPSAFFETSLPSLLVWHAIDSVIVTGGSTSGCVRATVVDALSHGYRPTVPIECVADKHESPHFANLYDIAAKYGDVRPVADVLAVLADR